LRKGWHFRRRRKKFIELIKIKDSLKFNKKIKVLKKYRKICKVEICKNLLKRKLNFNFLFNKFLHSKSSVC
jgi:hypothetical protein